MKYLILILFCAVKFGFTIPVGIKTYNLTFVESVCVSIAGGILGVIFFGYLSTFLIRAWDHFLGGTKFQKKLQSVVKRLSFRKKNKKVFSRRNKLIVKTKLNYGLIGLAFLTPVILSIPIGTFITVRFYPNLFKTFSWLIAAVVVWGIALSAAFMWL